MKAFHNDSAIKEKYLKRVRDHQAADELIRGIGYEKQKDGVFRGCAVGCTLNGYSHQDYETELGIPEWLARVEDTLFEGMNKKKSETWPERFLEAIPIGVDLDPIKPKFFIMLLEHTIGSMDRIQYDQERWPKVREAISRSRTAVTEMIRCHREGLDLTAAADSAALSAASAYSARSANSADSADSAAAAALSAYSAADSAWYSAHASSASADSAAAAALSADSTASAHAAARSHAFDYYADQLLELLKQSNQGDLK